MVELTQIMRQKDDLGFTQLLNRVRTASHTDMISGVFNLEQ